MLKKRAKKGFTLIELIVVVAILAVLAGVLIPVVGGALNKSKQDAANSDASAIANTLNEMLAFGNFDVGTAIGVGGKLFLKKEEINYIRTKLPGINLGNVSLDSAKSQEISTITGVKTGVQTINGAYTIVILGLKYIVDDVTGVWGEPY